MFSLGIYKQSCLATRTLKVHGLTVFKGKRLKLPPGSKDGIEKTWKGCSGNYGKIRIGLEHNKLQLSIQTMYETQAFEKWFLPRIWRREIHMEIENIKNFYSTSSPSPQNKSAFIFSPFKDSSWQIIFLLPYFDSIPKPPNTFPSLFVRHPARSLTCYTWERTIVAKSISPAINFVWWFYFHPSITNGRKASKFVFLARSENIFNVCPTFPSSEWNFAIAACEKGKLTSNLSLQKQ